MFTSREATGVYKKAVKFNRREVKSCRCSLPAPLEKWRLIVFQWEVTQKCMHNNREKNHDYWWCDSSGRMREYFWNDLLYLNSSRFRVSEQSADCNTEICSVHEGILTRALNIDKLNQSPPNYRKWKIPKRDGQVTRERQLDRSTLWLVCQRFARKQFD